MLFFPNLPKPAPLKRSALGTAAKRNGGFSFEISSGRSVKIYRVPFAKAASASCHGRQKANRGDLRYRVPPCNDRIRRTMTVFVERSNGEKSLRTVSHHDAAPESARAEPIAADFADPRSRLRCQCKTSGRADSSGASSTITLHQPMMAVSPPILSATMAGGRENHSWYIVTSHMKAKHPPISMPANNTIQAKG
jgi:hypothetical protein